MAARQFPKGSVLRGKRRGVRTVNAAGLVDPVDICCRGSAIMTVWVVLSREEEPVWTRCCRSCRRHTGYSAKAKTRIRIPSASCTEKVVTYGKGGSLHLISQRGCLHAPYDMPGTDTGPDITSGKGCYGLCYTTWTGSFSCLISKDNTQPVQRTGFLVRAAHTPLGIIRALREASACVDLTWI
eukprot:3823182-Rhodomonas_salina.1